MPRHRDFALHDRPSTYGFETLDALLQQLRMAIADAETFTEVLGALQLEGRQLDVDHLAREVQLGADVVDIVEHLAVWGDESFAARSAPGVLHASTPAHFSATQT